MQSRLCHVRIYNLGKQQQGDTLLEYVLHFLGRGMGQHSAFHHKCQKKTFRHRTINSLTYKVVLIDNRYKQVLPKIFTKLCMVGSHWLGKQRQRSHSERVCDTWGWCPFAVRMRDQKETELIINIQDLARIRLSISMCFVFLIYQNNISSNSLVSAAHVYIIRKVILSLHLFRYAIFFKPIEKKCQVVGSPAFYLI